MANENLINSYIFSLNSDILSNILRTNSTDSGFPLWNQESADGASVSICRSQDNELKLMLNGLYSFLYYQKFIEFNCCVSIAAIQYTITVIVSKLTHCFYVH